MVYGIRPPYSRWLWVVFTLALGVAILSNILRGQFRPKFPPILIVFICLVLWITLSEVRV